MCSQLKNDWQMKQLTNTQGICFSRSYENRSISSHVTISYRFYQFVTTRYTTDFYIIAEPHKHPVYGNLRKPINEFSHGIMASGIARGRVRTTTTTTESRKMAAILQETCSLGLPFTSLILDIHVMIK